MQRALEIEVYEALLSKVSRTSGSHWEWRAEGELRNREARKKSVRRKA
jgi:hypothetical protein